MYKSIWREIVFFKFPHKWKKPLSGSRSHGWRINVSSEDDYYFSFFLFRRVANPSSINCDKASSQRFTSTVFGWSEIEKRGWLCQWIKTFDVSEALCLTICRVIAELPSHWKLHTTLKIPSYNLAPQL